MAISSQPYPYSGQHLGRARIDVLTAVLKCALFGPGHIPAEDDQWFADLAGQCTGPGYIAGGRALAARTFEFDPQLGVTVLHCDPLVWDPAGFTVRYAVVYAAVGSTASSPLLCRTDLGSAYSPAGAPFQLPFPDGVYRL